MSSENIAPGFDGTPESLRVRQPRPWPATCATCGRPVRKSESHAGAPGSGKAVRHLACALGNQPGGNDR